MTDQPTSEIAGVEDRIFDVLIQHQRIPLYDGSDGNRCAGCDNLRGESDGSNSPRHARHLAALIAEAVYPPEVQRSESPHKTP